MGIVHHFPGAEVPADFGAPNVALVEMLEEALTDARSGRLQSFVGAGFTVDGMRYSMVVESVPRNVYEMLGSLTWLQHEYVERVTGEKT